MGSEQSKDDSVGVVNGEKKLEHVESEVLRRYGDGAEAVEPALCCPVDYDNQYLKILPDEIIEKDYGCGDPSKYVEKNETVLDLGSGAGKICYILSQKVGKDGRVIGVDFNDKMLNLARKYQDDMAEKIGYANVEFRKGMIQDLGLNLNLMNEWLKDNPIHTVEHAHFYESACEKVRKEEPLVKSDSIDVIVSNCVLNLVRTEQKKKLFGEMYRVLKTGGRAVISDIVCDEDPTTAILEDAELWSGCISGAFREDYFLQMFTDAGFYGVEVLVRQEEPWHVIDGIEFRSMTVRAYKGEEAPCKERNQAAVYRGPWETVADEEGNIYQRGQRAAVCDRTLETLMNENGPYAGQFIAIEPNEEVAPEKAQSFDASRYNTIRHPRESKGEHYNETRKVIDSNGCCTDGSSCC